MRREYGSRMRAIGAGLLNLLGLKAQPMSEESMIPEQVLRLYLRRVWHCFEVRPDRVVRQIRLRIIRMVTDTAPAFWKEQLSHLNIPEGLSLRNFSSAYFDERFTETSSFKDNAALLGRQTGIFEFENYERRLVFVEWKTCDIGPLSKKSDSFIQAFFLEYKLATKSPLGSLLPVCLGFVGNALEDESRFGYIFEMPEGSTKETSLLTMQSILGHSEHKAAPLQRAFLARLIATSLLRLHEVGWLHRGIHSGNILFCVNKGEPDLSKPILSGFEYPRPWRDTVRPDGLDKRWIIYAPPRLQGEVPRAGAWQMLDDIYGLGLLILEIGHWQALHELLCLSIPPVPPQQALRVRSWLIEEEVSPRFKENPLVKLHGFSTESDTDVLLAVASRCVHAYGEKGLLVEESSDQSDTIVKARVLAMFAEQVVKKLDGFQELHTHEAAGRVLL